MEAGFSFFFISTLVLLFIGSLILPHFGWFLTQRKAGLQLPEGAMDLLTGVVGWLSVKKIKELSLSSFWADYGQAFQDLHYSSKGEAGVKDAVWAP